MPWYDNPAFQSAAAPILLAFLILVAFHRQRSWSEPAAVFACFLVATYLIMGLSLFPLDSTRKIVLIAIIFFVIGLLVHLVKPSVKLVLPIAVSIGIIACYWTLWPWLKRQEWLILIAAALSSALFIIMISAGFYKASQSRRKFLALAAIFALSASVSSIVGASAKLGQLLMALSMPFFVAFALDWIKPFQQSRLTFLFLLFCIPSALLTVSASVYAEVPWFVLIALGLIPMSAFFSLPNSLDKRYKLWAELAVSAVPALLAVLLTWNAAGPVPF